MQIAVADGRAWESMQTGDGWGGDTSACRFKITNLARGAILLNLWWMQSPFRLLLNTWKFITSC